MRSIVLIVHNVRSAHNVGSLLRTAEGLGVQKVYLTGYTPFPMAKHDSRLPHVAKKTHNQIVKTALGAENLVNWSHNTHIQTIIKSLRQTEFTVCALEQTHASIPLLSFDPPDKIALIVGREVEGIEPDILKLCDIIVEIPMIGKKESFNVVQAAAMALYHCRFF